MQIAVFFVECRWIFSLPWHIGIYIPNTHSTVPKYSISKYNIFSTKSNCALCVCVNATIIDRNFTFEAVVYHNLSDAVYRYLNFLTRFTSAINRFYLREIIKFLFIDFS